MKKEVVIAIIFGFGLGLVITFGIYTAKQSLNQKKESSVETTNTNDTPKSNSPSHQITITSPQSNFTSLSEDIKISGFTSPNSFISILSTNSETITNADNQGNFSTTIKVENGPNIISLSSFSLEGDSASVQIEIVYLPPDLSNLSIASSSGKIEN